MKKDIKTKLQHIRLAEVQQFKNVSIYPLFWDTKVTVDHLVLKEALEKGLLTITEIDEGGHVPQLKVTNNADMPVLILDGEELFGAKQNRVLNTTVLLKKKSITIIPVSCTEQGRWHYQSKTFIDSGILMSPSIRSVKNRSVRESLRATGEHHSDQGAIWNGIHEQAAQAAVNCPTGAMRDIHEARREDISDYESHFPRLDGQQGILVAMRGEVIGMDMISYSSAYGLVHSKLIRSYIMDAVIQGNGNPPAVDKAKARQFLDDITECEVSRYKSIGHGWDLQFEGKALSGSALEYRSCMVHLAFFSSNGTGHRYAESGMAGYARRASYRRNNQGGNGS